MDTVRTTSEPLRIGERIAIAIATSGGVGYVPKAPGTAGSLVGALVYAGLEAAGLGRYDLHAIIFALAVGVWAAHRAEKIYGHDSSRIVIDEVIGQMLTFALARPAALLNSVAGVVLGFGLFRLYDIMKPYPIRHLEQLPGGVGVVADDIGAALYAFATLAILQFILRQLP